MSVSIDESKQQFAVIAVHSKPRCERLVIAYSNEKNLRDLFAAPSILGMGYRSLEAAVTDTEGRFARVPSSSARLGSAFEVTRSHLQRVRSGLRSLKCSLELSKTRVVVHRLLQNGLAAMIVIVFSKNALSAAARALISF